MDLVSLNLRVPWASLLAMYVILESSRGNCGTFQGVIRCLYKYFSAKRDVDLSV